MVSCDADTYISVTASPTPQNLASSSMPSSLMTVLSTSKHTASALLKSSFVCESDAIVLENKRNVQCERHSNTRVAFQKGLSTVAAQISALRVCECAQQMPVFIV